MFDKRILPSQTNARNPNLLLCNRTVISDSSVYVESTLWIEVQVFQLGQFNASYKYTIRISESEILTPFLVHISDPWMTPVKAKISNFNLTTFPGRNLLRLRFLFKRTQ